MKTKYLPFFLFFYIVLFVASFGQSTPPNDKHSLTDDQIAQIKSNAIDLVHGIGKNAADLTDVNQRIEVRLRISILLWTYDPDTSIELLEKVWRDTFSEDLKNRPYTNLQRNKIIDFASKIAPDKAKKWLTEIKKDKTDEENTNDKTKNLTGREKANLTLRIALANLDNNPEDAVSQALSSLAQTGKISTEFSPFVDKLSQLNRPVLITSTLKGVTGFIKDRPSLDAEDLLAAMNLMISKSVTDEYRNKLFSFLVASGRLTVINQRQNSGGLSSKLSGDQMDLIYAYFNFPLRVYVQNEFPSGLSSLDEVMSEMRQFVSSDVLLDPNRNPLPIEKQIEDAMKVVGSKERDARLVRIASWLLARRKGNEKEYLKMAVDVSDEISDLDVRERLRDYVKIAEIERFVEQKDFLGAEKKARSISLPELRCWGLIAIGKLQGEHISTSFELYDAALGSLEKAEATNYKTHLALILSALFRKNDEGKSIEILSQAVKFSNQAKGEKEEKHELGLMFTANLGGMEFDDYNLDMRAANIDIPREIGNLAVNFWYPSLNASQQMQPLALRLNLQRILAEAALKFVLVYENKRKKRQ